MRKIICVCLNPAVDKNIFMNNLQVGSVNRVPATSIVKSAGGKGVNVAKVVAALTSLDKCVPIGVSDEKPEIFLTGFIGGSQGDYIEREMRRLGIPNAFVHVDGETRTSLNIVDIQNDEETEILEEGFNVNDAQYHMLSALISEKLDEGPCVLVLSGGIPSGVPKTVYAELIKVAKEKDAFVILDSSGDAYRFGLAASPDLIKPNNREINQLWEMIEEEREKDSASDSRDVNLAPNLGETAKALISRFHIQYAVVSDGPGKTYLVSDDETVSMQPPKVEVRNTIGSGDSMVAGLSYAIASGEDVRRALKLGVACGAANTMQKEVGVVDPTQVAKIMQCL